jgi:hypothetical protein
MIWLEGSFYDALKGLLRTILAQIVAGLGATLVSDISLNEIAALRQKRIDEGFRRKQQIVRSLHCDRSLSLLVAGFRFPDEFAFCANEKIRDGLFRSKRKTSSLMLIRRVLRPSCFRSSYCRSRAVYGLPKAVAFTGPIWRSVGRMVRSSRVKSSLRGVDRGLEGDLCFTATLVPSCWFRC